ncbi:MAG: leucyl aminopeptidase family protein [Rhodospirillales bacterium]|jgi:leucyl aminopeptidase|nr:leucyl aminopeptidase [Rhodospirillaceae bacterium]MDP6110008.1 leucyl aminopeptidase family protein [Rhodospirillales bacterium]
MALLAAESDGPAFPVSTVSKDGLAEWCGAQPPEIGAWIRTTGFKAHPGEFSLLPDGSGGLFGVLLGLSADQFSMWDAGDLARKLPDGIYALAGELDAKRAMGLSLGWLLGAYEFNRYKEPKSDADQSIGVRLRCPENCDRELLENSATASFLVRDLINTPAGDMGPAALAEAAKELATTHDAEFSVIVGDDLLAANYPAIHAVGRAAAEAPRLVDLIWGEPDAPKVTLVGKGVCFDTGGLDLKPSGGMKLMKKDMGGAAHVLGLAQMIMAAKIPVRLRVLIPAVENSVSANAIRPLDVVPTRNGKTVEIGNTDAEGRVILADVLAEASSEEPDFIVDYATLTGAARVALGTELPALFCNDENFANAILAAGVTTQDQLWRLPLWHGYKKSIEGKTADLTNAPESGFGGAITAALFLQEFLAGKSTDKNAQKITAAIPWAHIDLMAWNLSSKPGRPEGGEAMSMRALFSAIAQLYSR